MADIKYYDVILKPVITEKSMNAMSDKKYTFLVHVDANKSMIKEAVEKMFPGTKVASVNTMNRQGKNKRRGLVIGKTAATKKAIVKLTEDSKEIEMFQGLECADAQRIDENRLTNYPPDPASGQENLYGSPAPGRSRPREEKRNAAGHSGCPEKGRQKGVKSHGN